MKTKDKTRKEQPHIYSIRVNSNDPPEEEMNKKKEKNQKRYRTVRVEDIDGQDRTSACPSIEKELPQLSIHAKKKGQYDDSKVINDLVKCNQLKEAALNKATAMIKLLSEENVQLNAKIEELESILRQKERTIQLFEEQVRINSSQDRILGKDIMSDREKDTLRLGKNNQHSYTPRQGRIKSKSELFFQFTHSKDRNAGNRKSQNKIISLQQPTFKDITEINISKKLSPFTSKNITKNYLQTQQQRTNKTIQELTMCVMKQQIYNGKFLFEELTQLISVEEDQYEEFMTEMGRLQNWVSNEELDGTSPQSVSLQKKLFNDGMQEDIASLSIRELIQGYQKIIQEYKEYAAYLKSYLCQCVNFLAGLTLAGLNSSRGEITLVPLLKIIARDITGRVGGKYYALREENNELKVIMEELIKNIEMARKREEPSVHPWSDFGLSIKQFQ